VIFDVEGDERSDNINHIHGESYSNVRCLGGWVDFNFGPDALNEKKISSFC
jgi:hypothetical protein